MSASGWVHLEVREIKKVTDKAMLLEFDDGEEVWMPVSQIADAGNYEEGDCDCTVSVTEWIAVQKGIR